MVTKKFYYGWWIVVASFCILFICAGIGFSTFPVFLKYLEADMQWNRTSLSAAGALAALAAGLTTPAVGWLIDRHGIRAAMIPGAILLSSAYLFLGRIETLHQFYALNLAVGLGMAGTTILPTQTLVARWFEHRRGRAMGIITIGNALGSVVWIPASNLLIETIGWRNTYEIFGIIIAVVSLPLMSLVIRTSPNLMGLQIDPYDDPSSDSTALTTEEAPIVANETGYTLREALATSSFWLIFLATFFVMFAQAGFSLHAISFLSDSGLSMNRATGIWAIAQGGSIGGRFLFGYLSERYQKRYFAAAANVSRGLSLLILILFAMGVAPLVGSMILLITLYGLGMGCNAVINPLLIGESFGTKSFGKVLGFLGIPYTVGMAMGQITGGRLFDLEKNYHVAFGLFAAAFVVAGVAVLLAKPCFLLNSLSHARKSKER